MKTLTAVPSQYDLEVWYMRDGDGSHSNQDVCTITFSNKDDTGESEAEREAVIRAFEAAPTLLMVLKELVPMIPPVDAPCHKGICAQDKCSFCRRVINAHAAIKAAEGEVK